MSQPDLFHAPRRAWNAGHIVGAKPPLKAKHVCAIRQHLKTTGKIRDPLLFNLALDSKLRACDLVRLRVVDVALNGAPRSRGGIVQQKTARPVPFEITETTRATLAAWIHRARLQGDSWVFPSRSRAAAHMSTRQYARRLQAWLGAIGLDPSQFGTHSLRRTKVAMIYKKTGNLRACQLLLGHRKLESTVRYLGIEANDALEMSEQIDL